MGEIALSCMVEPTMLHLDDFETRERAQVQFQQLSWDNAWPQLLQIALYGRGPDISEIGSTWLSSLIDMNALRPLTSWPPGFLRDVEQFFPAARWAIRRPGDPRIWALPLFTDTRVVYYRRSWLQQAGIGDAARAFQTPETLMSTLHRLQEHGFEVPWIVPARGLDTVYTAASFIWAAGGHFRTEDGRRLRLSEPAALAGLKNYLALHRFIAPVAQGLDVIHMDLLFRQGKAAAVISGPWLLAALQREGTILDDVGITLVPGVPFIGGSHLVLWRHAQNERGIVKLMQYLVSPEIQSSCFQYGGHLPARTEILSSGLFPGEWSQVLARSLNVGRVLRVSYRWVAAEQRLVDVLARLWSDLAVDPELDLEGEIGRRIAALCRDLERTILAGW